MTGPSRIFCPKVAIKTLDQAKLYIFCFGPSQAYAALYKHRSKSAKIKTSGLAVAVKLEFQCPGAVCG